MKDLIQKKRSAFEFLERARAEIKRMRDSKIFTVDTMKDMEVKIRDLWHNRAKEVFSDMRTTTERELATSQKDLKDSRTVDVAEFAQRTAVLGQTVSSMEYDEILRLYDKRFENLIDRTLIEQIAQIRIDGGAQTAELRAFADKWENAKERFMNRLPENEKAALAAVRKAEKKQRYVEKASTVLNCDFYELSGTKLLLDESVQRAGLRHEVDVIENEY
jgi:predicted ribosome quality control (RQC) complex YloA/Tae2 family protein